MTVKIRNLIWIAALALILGACANNDDSGASEPGPINQRINKEQSVDVNGRCTELFIADFNAVSDALGILIDTPVSSKDLPSKVRNFKNACDNFKSRHQGIESCKAELYNSQVNLAGEKTISDCSTNFEAYEKILKSQGRSI